MKNRLLILVVSALTVAAIGCGLGPLSAPTPLPVPTGLAGSPSAVSVTPAAGVTQTAMPSPTLGESTTTPTASPTATRTPTSTNTPLPTATSAPIVPTSTATASGPYAVVLVSTGDVLNIRSAPGAGSSIVGTFPPSTTGVMGTGRTATVGGALWIEVNRPGGGTGWVNSQFLTEYINSTTFCADTRITTLITNLKTALSTSNGDQLSSLVSPTHGTDVRLFRYGTVANYSTAEAKWVFSSTYVVNWGEAPGSGLDVSGTFHDLIVPGLLEVLNAAYTLHCNDATKASGVLQPWPPEYANVNFYAIHKPGTPGIDLDWRTWLIGFEYKNGMPYLFGMINFQWEP